MMNGNPIVPPNNNLYPKIWGKVTLKIDEIDDSYEVASSSKLKFRYGVIMTHIAQTMLPGKIIW